MKITCVSDLHGEFPELDGGDVLIVAGDATSNDTLKAWSNFFEWFEAQKYRKKIFVAGNHDNFCKTWATSDDLIYKDYPWDIETPFFSYLCDSGEEFEGVKFWGSPHSLWFNGINPHCMAFTGSESDLKKKFDLIPDDTDVLITHSPPYGILDEVQDYYSKNIRHCGSRSLLEKIEHVKPLYNVFGHIHEHGGKYLMLKHEGLNTSCFNCSQMNEDYEFYDRPVNFEL